MAVAAIVLFVVFLVLVIFVRVGIQVRRTGDPGVRRNAGWGDPVQRRIVWLATIGSVVLGVVSPVTALLGLPLLVDSRLVEIGGLVVTVLGTAATFGAQLAMGDSWRAGVDPDERTALVTSGPFRLVRNPILTAAMITCVGLALMVPTVVGLIGLAATIVPNVMLVRLVEEPHLRRVHGQDYERYAAAVGRFVPGVGRLG